MKDASARMLVAIALLALSLASHAEIVRSDYFGMHVHNLQTLRRTAIEPFGFLRLWDTGTTWAHLEPNAGNWDFHVIDGFVEEADKRHVQILYVLGMTPAWASSNPDAESNYFKGASSPPADIDRWRTYVRTVATRYKGRIKYWELWNEINVKQFYSGDLSTLVLLEQIASEELKAIDAKNVLLSASIQGGAFRQLDQYFAAGGGRYADGIAYHFYALKEEPEEVLSRINTVRALMRKYGLEQKPLWNTEFGWLIENRDGTFGKHMKPDWWSWRKVDQEEAPGIVMRALLMGLAGGVEASFWYAWDNSAMGLSENGEPKQAARAYTRLQEWVVGADFRGCQEALEIWKCHLTRNGKDSWIVWSQEKRTFSIPTEWHIGTVQRYVAAPTPINGGSIGVGPIPIRLAP